MSIHRLFLTISLCSLRPSDAADLNTYNLHKYSLIWSFLPRIYSATFGFTQLCELSSHKSPGPEN